MRIHNIQRASDGPTHHAHDDEREEEIGPKPSVPLCVGTCPAKSNETRAPKHYLRDHKHHAEFGLVDAIVQARQRVGAPVADEACEREAKESAKESARVHVTCFDFAEPERGTEHDARKNDADEYGEADEGTLRKAGPEDSWVQEERKGA